MGPIFQWYKYENDQKRTTKSERGPRANVEQDSSRKKQIDQIENTIFAFLHAARIKFHGLYPLDTITLFDKKNRIQKHQKNDYVCDFQRILIFHLDDIADSIPDSNTNIPIWAIHF